jgi:hypothetical protein
VNCIFLDLKVSGMTIPLKANMPLLRMEERKIKVLA